MEINYKMLKGIITAPKKWVVILFMLDIFICAGQQMPELRRNSIRHWTMLDSLGNMAIESVSYYDPLGRKEEAVGVDGGGIGVDLVRYSSYDRAGRIVRQYCPAPCATSGQPLTEQQVPLRMSINDENVSLIEYKNTTDNLFESETISEQGTDLFNEIFTSPEFYIGNRINASLLLLPFGGGVTISTANGSYSLVSKNSDDRAIISGHEVLGHGLSFLKGLDSHQNNLNAVRMDNLIRRLLHKQVYPTEKHFDYDYIKNNNPQDIPVY